MKLQGVARFIDYVTEIVGRTVAWLTLAMVLVGVAIVFLRYVLSIVFASVQELVVYMHATVFLVGAAYAMLHDDHVRVDVLYRNMTPKRKAVVNIAGTVLFVFPLSAIIFIGSYEYVLNSWAVLERSQHMRGIPAVFVLKSLIWVFAWDSSFKASAF